MQFYIVLTEVPTQNKQKLLTTTAANITTVMSTNDENIKHRIQENRNDNTNVTRIKLLQK